MSRYHELRIMLPLALDEYEVAHIYTRYKLKHHDGPKRAQTDVAQCTTYSTPAPNTPLPGGIPASSLGYGLYTHHVHLFQGILPQWAISMLNGSPLKVHGKTWDEYPYILSKYELPPIARANVQIDFLHVDQDTGNQHNVFNLNSQQLAHRVVEYCDITQDPTIATNNQKNTKADPNCFTYQSIDEKIIPSRGPLCDPKQNNGKTNFTSTKSQVQPQWYINMTKNQQNNNNQRFMCVYVLLSASFDLPLQMLRNHAIEMAISHFTQVVVELHRLAYIWMDEWDKYYIAQIQQDQLQNTNEIKDNNDSNNNNTPIKRHYNTALQLLMKDAFSNDHNGGAIIPPRPIAMKAKAVGSSSTLQAPSSQQRGIKGLVNKGKRSSFLSAKL